MTASSSAPFVILPFCQKSHERVKRSKDRGKRKRVALIITKGTADSWEVEKMPI